MTEDEMVGWHHRLDGHEFEQAPGVGDGQGSLACCSPWGRKESDTTERLNSTELKIVKMVNFIICVFYHTCIKHVFITIKIHVTSLSRNSANYACVHAKLLQLCLTLCNPMDHQAPLSMGFSRQKYWGGLPYPPLGDLPLKYKS